MEVQKLSLVHGSGQSALSRVAAPPSKKHWWLWSAAAASCAFPALANLRQPGLGTVIMIGCATLSIAFAFNAWTYNARIHPALLERWQQSYMCNRCGQMFPAP